MLRSSLAVTPRRLLMVDACEECEKLMPRLQAGGWEVHSCGLDEAGAAAFDVGMIRLRSQHLERPESLKHLISLAGTEWIAVLSAETLRQPEVGNFIGEWFFDFHTLPFDLERVNVALGRAFGMARLRGRSIAPSGQGGSNDLLGDSHSMRELRALIEKLAPTEAPVLIRGESGTGKELVAQTLRRLPRFE